MTTRSNIVTAETRTRMMLADMSTWTGLRLAMKKLPVTTLHDSFGVVYDTELPVMIYYYENDDARVYETVDALIADGWVVD